MLNFYIAICAAYLFAYISAAKEVSALTRLNKFSITVSRLLKLQAIAEVRTVEAYVEKSRFPLCRKRPVVKFRLNPAENDVLGNLVNDKLLV